jgi:anti-sigma factor RsiW
MDESIEAIAAGDLTPDDEIRAHLATCTRCRAALALARRVDAALGRSAQVRAPAHFTRSVLARIRRERWTSEELLDRWFNASMGVAAALIVGSIWMALNLTGLAAVLRDAGGVLGEGMRLAATRFSAGVATYGVAALMLGSALIAWWWAEQPDH